ncbi:MAG: ATP-binding protein, partial [Actinobacteria bacterium]
MAHEVELIGREAELSTLADVLAEVRNGKGGLVLIAGEAGVGKTRLADDALARSELLVLRGSAAPEGTPYGPIVGVLRAYLRAVPDGLRGVGPLERYLALLLPELGSVPERPDKQALVESIRRAFHEIGRHGASVVFLDDLHRADAETLDLLDGLSVSLEDERPLVLAAYRTDQIPRGHPLRRLRAE